jgi:uncharacterized protein YbaR (Trm112 family)
MLSKQLLEILICPSCHGDLEYDSEKETLTCSARHCPHCGMTVDEKGQCRDQECGQISDQPVGLRFHVEEDIPVMLIEEAERFAL